MTNHDRKLSSAGITKSILKYRDYIRDVVAYKQLAAYIMTYCILGLIVWIIYIGIERLL